MRWTNEQTLTLRKMFAAGYSDAEIGKTVGVTAHAVIGKRDRLKLYRIAPGMASDAYVRAMRRADRERRDAASLVP